MLKKEDFLNFFLDDFQIAVAVRLFGTIYYIHQTFLIESKSRTHK